VSTVTRASSLPAPAEVAAALRRAGVAEVDTSTRRRGEYSTDASNYRVLPRAVVFPRDADEVAATLAASAEVGVPVTARGAGTSVAGNSIGTGVVLDFSRHMNRVLSVDPDAGTAVAEPGAILDAVTAMAARHGLRFGPDPSTHARATVGGTLGNNACGPRAMAYGRGADNIVELDLITGSGLRITAGAPDAGGASRAERALRARLNAIVQEHADVIRSEFGRFRRQVSGYSLEHLLPDNGAHLGRFLGGTEGTLGVTTRATVRLSSAPTEVALAVLGYDDMATAAESVIAIMAHRPVALEGMDARLADVVRRRRGPAAVPDLPRGGGWLFVETGGDTLAEARTAAAALVADAGALDSMTVAGAHARALWRIREDGVGLAGRTPSGQPAWPGWEDAAVPPERLAAYLRDFFELMRTEGVDGVSYGHFGDGCIHVRLDFPLSSEPHRFRRFMMLAAQLVVAHRGSMSGEHGDGRARSELLPYMYSPVAMAAFAAVKDLFDPDERLNPGVLVRPAPLDADLRVPAARPLTALGFTYPEDRDDLSMAVHRCTGIGKCRAANHATGGVMCPSYQATRDEKDSTRGRARVLQELANGSLIHGFRDPAVHESLDLCLACKGCLSDCPASVDMATYKAEVLHQRYRRRIRPASHYVLGWLPRWARMASFSPHLANAVMQQTVLMAAAKRLGGIDPRRPLPRFAERSFRQWFLAQPATSGDPVLLWVDTWTNHFAPQVGIAAVRVLEDAGYAVQVTHRAVCCGLTWISTGQLDGARRQLRGTLAALAPALDTGIPIVGLEPSCTAVLRDDAARLLPDDPRVVTLDATTRTLAELLTSRGWTPPDLTGVTGVAQPHCHHHAVLGWDIDRALLADAGAHVTALGGCCGLAGNFGAERGHFDVSAAVAETALLPAVRCAPPGSVVLADGFSCRTQLDHLAGVRGVHMAELFADRLGSRDDRVRSPY
jgi:FAD/FMN-containing dehydrogenase/Fe-S oxidoreductase